MSSSIRNVSLYIPQVFSNYTKGDVAEAFEGLYIGKVSKVDFVLKRGKDNKAFNSAYIHFDYWYDNVAAVNFQARVLDPNQEARLIYDEPWYWIVLENKGKKHIPGDRKARINLGDKKETILIDPITLEDKILGENHLNEANPSMYIKEIEDRLYEQGRYIDTLHMEIYRLKTECAQFNLPV